MNDQIENRIKELTLEHRALEINHEAIVKQNQLINQEFQQQVVKNQTRYAQITGAITELQKLVEPSTQKDNNHDNLSTTPNLHNRIADVCPGREP